MNKATRQVYSRNANIWGFALYYMLMMEGLTQASTPDIDAVFDYFASRLRLLLVGCTRGPRSPVPCGV